MISEIIIPKLGATGGDVTLDEWLVPIGAFVNAGAPIATLTTDKATVELEAFRGGYLRAILARPGDTVPIATPIALLADSPDEPLGEYAARAITNLKETTTLLTANTDAVESQISNQKSAIENRKPQPPPQAPIASSSIAPVLQLPFLLALFRSMSLIRRFEDTLYQLFLQGLVPGTLHQYQGQEAVAVGVSAALNKDDVIFSTHRPVGHLLAKGSSARGVAAEIWGKAAGCAGGKGGQMHLCDITIGAPPSNAIVGANIPIATGAALAFQLRGEPRVAVSYFGDGATNIGAFHEGINLAAVKNAPVLFVCENNGYAASTHISLTSRVPDLAVRAEAYGIPGVIVDGMDVLAVYDAAQQAVSRARRGDGPTLLECKTYRYMGHSRGDPGGYRTQHELAEWRARDPIERLRLLLVAQHNVSPDTLTAIEIETQAQVDDAVAFAQAAPEPEPSLLETHIYA